MVMAPNFIRQMLNNGILYDLDKFKMILSDLEMS